jgi:hypothetical protein
MPHCKRLILSRLFMRHYERLLRSSLNLIYTKALDCVATLRVQIAL